MIGHEAVRRELEEHLPPVTLLLGPPSIGKTALAEHLVRYHRLREFAVPLLTAANARDVVNTAPVMVAGKCFVVNLDTATATAQNILLKVLEEPPEHARFILVSSVIPLPTVVSRSVVYRLAPLTPGQLAEVLVSFCGAPPDEALEVAARARGRVAPALAALADSEGARVRSVVSAAIKAAAEGGVTFELALRSWTSAHTVVLRQWAEEAASGRWSWFRSSFAPDATPQQARRVLAALGSYDQARTAAAVALDSAFREKE